MLSQSIETKSVKSIPKDFSKAKPVKGDKLSQRRQIQSKETNPVKGDKFSQRRQIQSKETKPVNGDKIS